MKISKLIDEMFGMKPVLSDEDNVTVAVADEETYIGDPPYDNVTADQVDTGLVPVQMLQDVPLITVERAARGFATSHETVSSSNPPVRIVTRNLRRRAVTLIFPATNTGNVAIGSAENVRVAGIGNGNGHAEFPPGSAISMETTSEIWAQSSVTATQDIMIIQLTEDA